MTDRKTENTSDSVNIVDHVGENLNGQHRRDFASDAASEIANDMPGSQSDSGSKAARESANGPDYGGGEFGSSRAETPNVSHDKEFDASESNGADDDRRSER